MYIKKRIFYLECVGYKQEEEIGVFKMPIKESSLCKIKPVEDIVKNGLQNIVYYETYLY